VGAQLHVAFRFCFPALQKSHLLVPPIMTV